MVNLQNILIEKQKQKKKRKKTKRYLRENPQNIVNTNELKCIQSANHEISHMFRNKINQTNKVLSLMRAGGRLKATGIFSPENYTRSNRDNHEEEKVQHMLDNIKTKKADSTTKLFKQYDKLLKCLQYKDEIVKKQQSESVDFRNKSVIEHIDSKDLLISQSGSKESIHKQHQKHTSMSIKIDK